MITIIAGEIDAGKTSKMIDLYNKNHQGDGFVCKKVFENNIHSKYEFMRLSDSKTFPFMVKQEFIDNPNYYDQTFKRYKYSALALTKVFDDIKDMVKNSISPIYLDEIGKLELLGQGHDKTLRYLLKENVDIIIAVRSKFVNEVINNYNLSNYRIVGVQDE